VKCRHIRCPEPVVGFIRIFVDYEDGGPPLDADWPYCYAHLQRHKVKQYRELDITYFDTLEGFRHE
jgi:hypothetical protein